MLGALVKSGNKQGNFTQRYKTYSKYSDLYQKISSGLLYKEVAHHCFLLAAVDGITSDPVLASLSAERLYIVPLDTCEALSTAEQSSEDMHMGDFYWYVHSSVSK
jgi:hypothetical protein